MVVIGLLDTPPEIRLQVAEYVETGQTLKALSVTSRSLRCIAQPLLFERLRINFKKPLRGSIDDLLANPQICAAIRFLELSGRSLLNSRIPHSDEQKLSLIQKLLPELVGLRRVWIHQLNLSMSFVATFLEIAAKIPLRVNLRCNIYPSGISSMSDAPLRISHLHLGSITIQRSLDFYRTVFSASAATLTELNVVVGRHGLMHVAGIDLPCLHTLVLMITMESELSRTSVAALLTVQKSVRKLDLRGKMRPLHPLPPSVLPNLQELYGPTEVVNQLVPGRPVEAIEVSADQPSDQDWFGEEVARSTARVRKLRVHLRTEIRETRMVGRMVTILPSLESLWLPVSDHTLLETVEVVTSLKHLTHLRISLYSDDETWYNDDETWANHDVGAIATGLRKANSCLSFMEIREGGMSGWRSTISVWNEVLGVFCHMQSVSPL